MSTDHHVSSHALAGHGAHALAHKGDGDTGEGRVEGGEGGGGDGAQGRAVEGAGDAEAHGRGAACRGRWRRVQVAAAVAAVWGGPLGACHGCGNRPQRAL